MTRRKVWSLWVLAICLAGRGLSAADNTVPAISLIPTDALLVLQVAQPETIIQQAFSPQVKTLVTNLPWYEQTMNTPETKQALGLLRYFQEKLGGDTPQLLDALVGGGITLAVLPGETNLLIVDAKNADQLKDVHDFFRAMAETEAEKRGDADSVRSAEYKGITGWKFGPGEVHAVVGSRLILSNKPEGLKAAIDRQLEGSSSSLADVAAYRQACAAAGAKAAVIAYANLSVLKQLPPVQKAMNEDGNPLTMLLFAPLQAALRDATWLAGSLELGAQTIQLKLTSDSVADAAESDRGFATPKTATAGAVPQLEVPRRIAGFSFYRDLHQFYAAKDKLFPERTSGLIFFENMMGIFFTGRDLTEEVLAESEPDVRVVVASQQYGAATPAVQFPGFAIVVGLRNPEKFGPVVEEAWQKAIGLINFTRGQNALPGLIIDRPVHKGIKYTTASFSAADEPNKTEADVRFNFEPAVAIQGNHLILSSTGTLAKDLIDALVAEGSQAAAVAGEHTLGLLDGQNLQSILTANREVLVRQNMIEDGNSREQAEKAIDLMLTIVRSIRHAQVRAGCSQGQSHLVLELGYELP